MHRALIGCALVAASLAACIPGTSRAKIGAFEEVSDEVSSPLGHGVKVKGRRLFVRGSPIDGRLWLCEARQDAGEPPTLLDAHRWPLDERVAMPRLGMVRTETHERAVDPATGRWLENAWQPVSSPQGTDPDGVALDLKCCGSQTHVRKEGRTVSRFVRNGDGGARDVASFESASVDPERDAFTVHCSGDGDLVVTARASDDASNRPTMHAWLWRRASHSAEDFGSLVLPSRPEPATEAIGARVGDGSVVVSLRTRNRVTHAPEGHVEVTFRRRP